MSRKKAERFIIFLTFLCVGASGYPMYLHGHNKASSCFDHPSKPIARHLAPVIDKSISIAVTLKGKPVTGLCPGEKYDITVRFPQPRAALATVSQGTIAQSNVARCANVFTTTGRQLVKNFTASWQVTCSMLGGVEIKLTSGVNSTGHLLKAQLGLPVLRLSQCPGNKCVPAAAPKPKSVLEVDEAMQTLAASAAAAATAASAQLLSSNSELESAASTLSPAKAAAAVATNTDRSAAAAASTASATEASTNTNSYTTVNGVLSTISAAAPATLSQMGAACTEQSQLGYQCATGVTKGVTIHYSLGGDPPGNECTQESKYDRPAGVSKGNMMHFAIQSNLPGYLGLGFPTRPGRMVPADAVIGTIEDKTGVTKVASYRLTSTTAAGVQPSEGWATGISAVRRFNISANSPVTTLCFSRPVMASGALTSSLNPSVVPMIWASHTSDNFAEHKLRGSLVLNMISGKYSDVSEAASGNAAARTAHGALMLLAFCILMPAAMLLARHKWIFGDAESGRLVNSWRHLHQALQLLAVLCVIASFGLAMAIFFSENGNGAHLHQLYSPHFGLGVAVVALSVLQLAGGFFNPGVGSEHLQFWRAGHYSMGWATLLLGLVNCFFGVVLLHDLRGTAYATWLAPMCVFLGLLGLIGLVLEVPKRTLQRKGRYDPATLTYRSDITEENIVGLHKVKQDPEARQDPTSNRSR